MRFTPSRRLLGAITALVVAAALTASLTAGRPPASPSRDLFSTTALFVDPHSQAAVDAAAALRSGDRADYPALAQLARYPTADWLTGQSPAQIRSRVAARVTVVRDAKRLPVLVLYDIPHRDCGLYSAGGAPTDVAYRAWVRAVAAGVATRRAVIVVEPDALAHLTDCLDAAGQAARLADLRYAVATMASLPGTAVYLDAGSSGWHGTAVMATRLRMAGVGAARGFALNTSDFKPTTQVLAFGDQLSASLGGKHFIVDTSRNGLGSAPGQPWCMPPGRALGLAPGTPTHDRNADALLWIKNPGRSDGSCHSGMPPAGAWDRAYAVGLVRRALTAGTLRYR